MMDAKKETETPVQDASWDELKRTTSKFLTEIGSEFARTYHQAYVETTKTVAKRLGSIENVSVENAPFAFIKRKYEQYVQLTKEHADQKQLQLIAYKERLTEYELEKQRVLNARESLWNSIRVCTRCGYIYMIDSAEAG
jgi:hypothetical protein